MATRDPQAVLDCRSADGAAALSLPGPNWALPVDVSMRPEEPRPAGVLPESLRGHLESLQPSDGIRAPVCLRDDCHLRLWHCQDTSFGIPKVMSKLWMRACQAVPCCCRHQQITEVSDPVLPQALLYMHVMNPCVYENPR